MQEAAKLFLGEHDFRNFCKMDAENVSNYHRCILHISISPYDENLDQNESDCVYVFTVTGTAFLWHQIRCMIAVLFLIGEHLEAPQVISDLLDITKVTKKPLYDFASGIPLVLYECLYEKDDIKWQGKEINIISYKTIRF